MRSFFWHAFVHDSVSFYHITNTSTDIQICSVFTKEISHATALWQILSPLFKSLATTVHHFIILLSTETCISGIIQYIALEIGFFFFSFSIIPLRSISIDMHLIVGSFLLLMSIQRYIKQKRKCH